MTGQNFYSQLQGVDDFSNIAEPEQYVRLPDDWIILTSDVVESTRAIEAGCYKQVNMVGAASNICILNACGEVEVPFSFGGDGGLVAVPASLAERASEALQKLQSGSEAMFGLELRAAAIPLQALRAAGGDIRVRKFILNAENHLAMFSGGGTELAEAWLKSADPAYDEYKFGGGEMQAPDLEGLSCRWEPLDSVNGIMLTLIINQLGDDPVDLAGQISRQLRRPLSAFAPASKQSLKFRFPPQGLKLEVDMSVYKGSYIKRYLWTLFTATLQALCERFKLKIGDYDGAVYRKELMASTDFRKYDGGLRMVLDISPQQADELEAWLEAEYKLRRLVYGSWRSKSALMTCMLFNLAQSRHLHLVDGADGGYALAAKDYKHRMNESNS